VIDGDGSTDAATAAPSPAAEPALVELRNLSKTFGRTTVLKGVSLEVRPREIHGLLGQNGSGKSTLIKILAGFHEPDEGGELRIRGEPVRLPLRPGQFRALGISFVHQDLALIPTLSVAENLAVGRLARSERRVVRLSGERRRARAVFERYGIDIDPRAQVARLSSTDRALLAIVRAVEELRETAVARAGANVPEDDAGGAPTLLVLDEPTAFLPRTGVELLFGLVRSIAARGAGVLFVTHDLDEALELTDRTTVLFNGAVAGTVGTRSTSHRQLVELIVGRRLELLEPEPERQRHDQPAVSLQHVSDQVLQDVSFDVHRGEIVGVASIVGAGSEEIPYAIFGASPSATGTVVVDGRAYDVARLTPARAIEAGMALIPAERARDGSIGTLSVADNVTMLTLDDYERAGFLRRRGLVRGAARLGERFDVRPNDPRMPYTSLSGGNQQKVVLAKWFETRPSFLLLHEPTQGVDVGARHQIYQLIRDAAAAGTAVLCASTDYEQLALLCDRVLVLARGRLFRELTGTQLTKERITAECLAALTGSSLEQAREPA